MTRIKKIQLLKDIQAGRINIKLLFQRIEVCLLHVTDDYAFDMDRHKSIRKSEIPDYIKEIKKEHPLEIIEFSEISKGDFDRISKNLENIY